MNNKLILFTLSLLIIWRSSSNPTLSLPSTSPNSDKIGWYSTAAIGALAATYYTYKHFTFQQDIGPLPENLSVKFVDLNNKTEMEYVKKQIIENKKNLLDPYTYDEVEYLLNFKETLLLQKERNNIGFCMPDYREPLIQLLCIEENYRRNGNGTHLFRAALHKLFQKHQTLEAFIHVHKDNDSAIKFYQEKFQFQIVGTGNSNDHRLKLKSDIFYQYFPLQPFPWWHWRSIYKKLSSIRQIFCSTLQKKESSPV